METIEKEDVMERVNLLILRSARLRKELEMNATKMIIEKEIDLIYNVLGDIEEQIIGE